MASEALFPVIWKIVNRLMEENDVSSENVAEAIKQVLKYYNDSCLGFIDLHYDQAQFTCAYIYLYFTSHIRMVQHFFEDFWERDNPHFASWFETLQCKNDGKLNVCSVGGGPGSDIFGLYYFMKEHAWPMRINATVLDQYTEWNKVAQHFNTFSMEKNMSFHGDIQYIYYNFFEDIDITLQEEISRADLVTMVKFMSAVGGNENDGINNFQKLLLFMKPGSLLFFIDNSGGGYRQCLQKIAESLDFHNIDTVIRELFSLDDKEMRTMRSHKIYCSPQTKANVTASLWRKPGITMPPSPRSSRRPLVIRGNSVMSSESSPETDSSVEFSWRQNRSQISPSISNDRSLLRPVRRTSESFDNLVDQRRDQRLHSRGLTHTSTVTAPSTYYTGSSGHNTRIDRPSQTTNTPLYNFPRLSSNYFSQSYSSGNRSRLYTSGQNSVDYNRPPSPSRTERSIHYSREFETHFQRDRSETDSCIML